MTEEGALYSFGSDGDGQLGHGSFEVEHSPKKMDALRDVRITSAAGGAGHSLVLAEDGTVFSWGSNSRGQLGVGRSEGFTPWPRRVEALSGLKVRSVAVWEHTSYAVSAAGELFTWGYGLEGRLGHGPDVANEHTPRRVKAFQGE